MLIDHLGRSLDKLLVWKPFAPIFLKQFGRIENKKTTRNANRFLGFRWLLTNWNSICFKANDHGLFAYVGTIWSG
jgi:hypothetical protein